MTRPNCLAPPLQAISIALLLTANCGTDNTGVRSSSPDADAHLGSGAVDGSVDSDADEAGASGGSGGGNGQVDPTRVSPIDAGVDIDASGDADDAIDRPEVEPTETEVGPTETTEVMEALAEVAAETHPETEGGLADCPGPSCVPSLAPGHLQLWLSGDGPKTCDPIGTVFRLSEWQDASGRGRHARPPTGKLGPLCGPSAGSIKGRTVVTFPRTMGLTSEEHLEVDLHSLQMRDFTIAVVERRVPSATRTHAYVMGTKLPSQSFVDCGRSPNNARGLLLGYERPDYVVFRTMGPECSGGAIVEAPGTEPNVMLLVHRGGTGLTLFADGREFAAPSEPPLLELNALIGRGWEASDMVPESRYRGDLAELIVYDVALSASDRVALTGHLRKEWNSSP